MKADRAMGVEGTYQNFVANVAVDLYSNSFPAVKTLSRNDIVGLQNGVTVNLAAEELPDLIKDAFEGKIPGFVKWILTEEAGVTRICTLRDCQVNIDTGDSKRDFILNDAMYKALRGLVSSNRSEEMEENNK